MTIPANPTLFASPYGASPVVQYAGPEGGPYSAIAPQDVTVLPSAVRNASVQSAFIFNYAYRGLYLDFNVTANPGGGQTLALSVFTVEPVSGNTPLLLSVAASVTPGGRFALFPGASGAAVEGYSVTRNLQLPAVWAVIVTHSGAGNWTYSIGGHMLP